MLADSAGATLIPRVVIVGGAGIGKTRLATCLSCLLDLPLIEEGVREWLRDRGERSPLHISRLGQIALQHHVLRTKTVRERAMRKMGFVSDRSVVDAFSLLALRIGRAGFDALPSFTLEHAWDHATRVPSIVVLPPAPSNLDDDPARPSTFLMRRHEHMCIEHLAVATGRPILRLTEGPTAEWLDMIYVALRNSQTSITAPLPLGEAINLTISLAKQPV